MHRAVSDVYQDLFGEGSFTGKGIYDLDAFDAAMADRVPENALLSHDLFEGVFARAGLVTDIELFDEFPSQLPGLGGSPAPLGAGRLAAPALDPGPGPRRDGPAESGRHSRHRQVEDGRQPAPDDVRPARRGHARRGLDASVGLGQPVDRVRHRVGDPPRGAARPGGTAATTTGHLQAQPPPRRGRGHRPRRGAGGPRPGVPRPPGVADARRDAANPGSAVCHPAAPPRMDDRGAGQGQPGPRPRRVLPPDGGRRRDCGCHRGPRPCREAGGGLDRRAVRLPVADLAPGRPMGQHATPRIRPQGSFRPPTSRRSA